MEGGFRIGARGVRRGRGRYRRPGEWIQRDSDRCAWRLALRPLGGEFELYVAERE